MNDADYDALAERGLTHYDTVLKPILEPTESGRHVAIHAESGDYATGYNSSNARFTLRKQRPTGFIVTRKIGNEPDYALAGRILAGEMMRGAVK